MKFRDGGGEISNVLYENIIIEEPRQVPIWIGPAQQADNPSTINICAASPCSLCWPTIPFTKCNAVDFGIYKNITLRNIQVNNAKQSPGVILGSSTYPMENIVFDNVVFNNPGTSPWGKDFYKC